MKNIFIIGSKGIPANYGGFETFVDYLTKKRVSKNIKYHVSCLADNQKEFEYNGARCFNVAVPNVGSAKAIFYDLISLKKTIDYIQMNNLTECTVYILACRIGPFIGYYKRKLKKMGVKLYVNPDGHEWKRSKWSKPIRTYWKYSEKLMVKHSDLLICDSVGIETYIKKDYHSYSPKTTFIAYGADIIDSVYEDKNELVVDWFDTNAIKESDYYLIVGRFVPENNYELMIREFMKSSSQKDLVIISNVEENEFYSDLLKVTKFTTDSRIKFVGTVYNQELLKKIREKAYGYIHGHEVGGTNPSLLEALASTKLNLLLDVVFNKEVGGSGAYYFSKEEANLADLLEQCDRMIDSEINSTEIDAKNRIKKYYSWQKIINEYEQLFLEEENTND
ncbi:beta 1-4 rhamnosyltransferase Cps2T [Carnobacterium divergens]|uniref:beta 1-4 rhamnosyltransferase Cps2T n=1 Tax=Carnobacterium divergens TaxID=2748 RepID=UPI0039AF3072